MRKVVGCLIVLAAISTSAFADSPANYSGDLSTQALAAAEAIGRDPSDADTVRDFAEHLCQLFLPSPGRFTESSGTLFTDPTRVAVGEVTCTTGNSRADSTLTVHILASSTSGGFEVLSTYHALRLPLAASNEAAQ